MKLLSGRFKWKNIGLGQTGALLQEPYPIYMVNDIAGNYITRAESGKKLTVITLCA